MTGYPCQTPPPYPPCWHEARRFERRENKRRLAMLKTIKLLTIATIVAGSASSAFAANAHHRDHGRTQKIERYSDAPLFEGRNSAPQWGYSNGTSTSRDTMVQEAF